MSEGDERGPRRTCVACREEADRDALLRLARSPDGDVVPDLKGSLPGRGAWVHLSPGCLERVERERGLLSRAFREPTDAGPLRERVGEVWRAAVADALSLAAAGGGLVSGHDAVEGALRVGEVDLLLAAVDASDRVRRLAGSESSPWRILPLDREAIGRRIGTEPRAVLGVRPVACTTHLRRVLRRAPPVG